MLMTMNTMTTTITMLMTLMSMLPYNAVAAITDDSSYSYSFQVNASTPFKIDGLTGEPIIDQCVDWDYESVSLENFTWYGFRIQLPDGSTTTGSGFHFIDVTQATKEFGLVQPYNTTRDSGWQILGYGITTQEAKPTIKINLNDRLFWKSYTFDFMDGDDDYQEFTFELTGDVGCYGSPKNATTRIYLTPVVPTLVISLRREGGNNDDDDDDDDALPSPDPTSAAGEVIPQAKVLGLTLATIISTVLIANIVL